MFGEAMFGLKKISIYIVLSETSTISAVYFSFMLKLNLRGILFGKENTFRFINYYCNSKYPYNELSLKGIVLHNSY